VAVARAVAGMPPAAPAYAGVAGNLTPAYAGEARSRSRREHDAGVAGNINPAYAGEA
jgi:hypothetical protein